MSCVCVCVKCKGRGDYCKHIYDKKPVIQVDYSNVTQKTKVDDGGKHETISATVLSVVDITSGMSASSVVKIKGTIDYAINELVRSAFEVGRPQGVLQSIQEPAIR